MTWRQSPGGLPQQQRPEATRRALAPGAKRPQDRENDVPIECPECFTWHPVAHYDTAKVRCEACDHVWDPLPDRS